ncbi:50S ribosomal protein L17 [Desulfoplanes sp.]
MRHKKSGRKFSRTMEHRKAMFKNMSRALLTYERIRTTLPKAKELRKFVEPLITLALKNDVTARREAYKMLGSHQLVQKLFNEIGPRYTKDQHGGYTRIVKFGQPREGDSAQMALIELKYLASSEEDSSPSVQEAVPADEQKDSEE